MSAEFLVHKYWATGRLFSCTDRDKTGLESNTAVVSCICSDFLVKVMTVLLEVPSQIFTLLNEDEDVANGELWSFLVPLCLVVPPSCRCMSMPV